MANGMTQLMLKLYYNNYTINYLIQSIMKKILFVALGATLLAAGCQKTEIVNPVNPTGKTPMSFSTEIAKLTKSAVGTGIENLQDQGFKLSAVIAYEDIYTTDTEFNTNYDGLSNKQFTYDKAANKWEIEGGQSYFWPGTGKELVFFAVSSAKDAVAVPTIAANGFGISGTKDDATGAYTGVGVSNYKITDYVVTAPTYAKTATGEIAVGTQTGADDDLMIAEVVIRHQSEPSAGNNNGEVDLMFNHTLSKVQFVFTTNSTTASTYPVTVKSVVIEDVINKATLNVEVESDLTTKRTSNNTYDWSPEENTVLYALTPNEGNTTDFTIDYDLTLNGSQDGQIYATWLVIPQTLTNKMVSVTYTIGDAANTTATPKEFTSVWPLYTTTLTAWERNQYIKYTVNLSPNMITFKPSVETDWAVGGSSSLNN